MEIIGIFCFLAGISVFQWYKSGEKNPENGLPLPVGDAVEVLRVHECFADGFRCDLNLPGPPWAAENIRVKMPGAKVPGGKMTGPEEWLVGIITDQMRGIVAQSKSIMLTGIVRGKDGSLTADIIVDGVKLKPQTYEPAPAEPIKIRPQIPAPGQVNEYGHGHPYEQPVYGCQQPAYRQFPAGPDFRERRWN